MSWAEVFKINSNMNKPINEQIRESVYKSIRVIKSTSTFVPEKTGIYKIICVGAGGDGDYKGANMASMGISGAGGGVAVKTLQLSKTSSYDISIGDASSFKVSENYSIVATNGNNGSSINEIRGGTASGGDENYTGTNGTTVSAGNSFPLAGSVGIFIGELYREQTGTVMLGSSLSKTDSLKSCVYNCGGSLLGLGGGGTGAGFYTDDGYSGGVKIKGMPGGVIIIPLEMEE